MAGGGDEGPWGRQGSHEDGDASGDVGHHPSWEDERFEETDGGGGASSPTGRLRLPRALGRNSCGMGVVRGSAHRLALEAVREWEGLSSLPVKGQE